MITFVATFTGPVIFGFILFNQYKNKKVSITINLRGFKPNETHALHVHEFGDFRNGCVSCGGHFNPFKKNHGSVYNTLKANGRSKNDRHVGDLLNNITTDENGQVNIEFTDNLINLYDAETNILGRSVVIHEGIDDLGLGSNDESLVSGNAGKRIAYAVIGIADTETN